MTDVVAQQLIEAEKIYLDFLDTNVKYQDRIKKLILKEERRIIIDLNDLRIPYRERVEELLKHSFIEIFACQKALKRCIANINPEYSNKYEDFLVGFEGSFGSRQLNPRHLTSSFLGNMVCVEGIVTKSSIVKSKVVHSVHYCPTTNKTLERRYTDMTSVDPFPFSGAYPTKDELGNNLETEFGLSTYKDSQTITIQEMPENAPAGQLPRSVEVILDNDLVDSCKAGDRVYVSGQFRCLPGKRNGFTTATFRVILIANNVYPITQKSSTSFEDSDFVQIRKMAKRGDIVDMLTRSIAPSICGHEFIKRAVLCQMLGGVERVLLNGSRIRGDINILLLGDPSVAKSQILRFVLQCARDRAVATTGRGSTGVGLTAAVVTDRETGERGLEAGAMVLADRGIVCIDEFDKMSDIDRTAIHEVMEQGRVTIAKAGIHAKLNARCSVLAAANPVYGRYDQYKTPMENIGLQDSLLSRFDLLFIMLDQCDPDNDRAIAEFVCKMHQYRSPGEEEGEAMGLQNFSRVDYVGGDGDDATGAADAVKKRGATDIFEKINGVGRQEQCFTKEFLEKYIHVARQLKPKLSKEASSILHEKYCELRSQETEMANNRGSNKFRTQPITVRTMETLIRLATAHAKARLKKVVSPRDAEAAADLISFVMFREVLKKTNKRSKPMNESDDESEVNSLIDDFVAASVQPSKKKKVADSQTEEDEENKENEATETGDAASCEELTEAEMAELTKALSSVFRESSDNSMSINEMVDRLKQQGNEFNDQQIRDFIQRLHDDNRVMLAGETIFLL